MRRNNEPEYPSEVAFVRRFGVRGTVLLVEFFDTWPSACDLEGTSPMSLAFQEGMDAGMSVILFVPHELHRVRTRINKPSMGDGMLDLSAKTVLTKLIKMNTERVALYHLAENTCPAPPVGVRITGLLPGKPPESRWLIAHRPNSHHLIPTSANPNELLSFILGMSSNTQTMPPTQTNLETTWTSWRNAAELPADRPCPIRRWIAK